MRSQSKGEWMSSNVFTVTVQQRDLTLELGTSTNRAALDAIHE
jgi:hypothetical protein